MAQNDLKLKNTEGSKTWKYYVNILFFLRHLFTKLLKKLYRARQTSVFHQYLHFYIRNFSKRLFYYADFRPTLSMVN